MDKTNDESSGTFVEKCRKSPISGLFRHLLPIFGRQYAKFLLKTLGEIAGRAEARSLGDFIHGEFAFLSKAAARRRRMLRINATGVNRSAPSAFCKVPSAPCRDPAPVAPRQTRHPPDAVYHSTHLKYHSGS